MIQPAFTIQDIKYSVDEPMFLRAQKLFEAGKVQNIDEGPNGYTATVQGTSPYQVSLSRKDIDRGYCDCYMGQNDQLCKHMLALGLAVLHLSGKIEETKEYSPDNLEEVKRLVAQGMRKIKPYNGPSKIWFSYQRELDVGSGIIEEAIKNLPASKENAKYIWALVLKLSKKLSHGRIDDSNGTVGNCISSLVEQCGQYAQKNPDLKPMIQKFTEDDTGFGFEEELSEIIS
ncbi:MAG: SWIM zinc finger family protein [Patescibacteria group bacterium]